MMSDESTQVRWHRAGQTATAQGGPDGQTSRPSRVIRSDGGQGRRWRMEVRTIHWQGQGR